MKIEMFEQTGLTEVCTFINKNRITSLELSQIKELMKSVNLSFSVEKINRLQSTLLCEMKDSYVQQSQRYVTMSQHGFILPQINPRLLPEANELIKKAFDLYARMTEIKEESKQKGRPKIEDYKYGIPIEDGRYILPLACSTNVFISISGDKFVDMLLQMAGFKYNIMMGNIAQSLISFLPENILDLIYRHSTYLSSDEEIIKNFYYDTYFSKITDKNKIVLFDSFKELDLRVAAGAITSTNNHTSSEIVSTLGSDFDTKGIINRVTGYGHTGVCEQARTTFGMMMSLTAWHQQLRHRLPTVYREDLVNVLNDVKRPVVIPQSIKNSPFIEEYTNLVNEFKKFRAYQMEENEYAMLPFLLNCDQLKIVISTNARMDEWILKERTCQTAHWEIRSLATNKLLELRKLSSILYEKALPPCVYGKCKEGAMTCGKSEEVKNFFTSLK